MNARHETSVGKMRTREVVTFRHNNWTDGSTINLGGLL